jgi:hypothetical protein
LASNGSVNSKDRELRHEEVATKGSGGGDSALRDVLHGLAHELACLYYWRQRANFSNAVTPTIGQSSPPDTSCLFRRIACGTLRCPTSFRKRLVRHSQQIGVLGLAPSLAMNAATLARLPRANPSAVSFDDGQLGRIFWDMRQHRGFARITQFRQFHSHLMRHSLNGAGRDFVSADVLQHQRRTLARSRLRRRMDDPLDQHRRQLATVQSH